MTRRNLTISILCSGIHLDPVTQSRSMSKIPGKDFTVRNERNSEVPGKTRQSEWRGTCGANSWGRERGITHETPIRFVGLAARVHRLRSGRLCGGCRASSRRSRCPSAVRLDRSRLLRGRVLPRLSRAWVLRASSPSLAVVAARSVGRSSHGGARSPGRRRFFPINRTPSPAHGPGGARARRDGDGRDRTRARRRAGAPGAWRPMGARQRAQLSPDTRFESEPANFFLTRTVTQ